MYISSTVICSGVYNTFMCIVRDELNVFITIIITRMYNMSEWLLFNAQLIRSILLVAFYIVLIIKP
jgi:hypothetical protein